MLLYSEVACGVTEQFGGHKRGRHIVLYMSYVYTYSDVLCKKFSSKPHFLHLQCIVQTHKHQELHSLVAPLLFVTGGMVHGVCNSKKP